LLDPDDEEWESVFWLFWNSFFCCCRNSTIEHEDEDEVEEIIEEEEEEETPVDDNQIKPFSCTLCSISFSKFEGYRDHFISPEHRYKRRDEKKRLGVCITFFYLKKITL
jgi:hypothetical protein